MFLSLNDVNFVQSWIRRANTVAVLADMIHAGTPGGAYRDRTDDLLNANQALSQLSYSPRYSAPSGATAPIALLPERQPRSRSYWSDSPLWSALLIRALVRPINHLILCGEIGLEAPYGSIPFLIDERNVLNPPGDIGYRLNGSTLEACLRGTKERVVN